MAAVIMVIVIAVVGAGAYYGFKGTTTNNGSGGKPNTIVTCSPPTSPVCASVSGGHDIFLNEQLRTIYQGSPVPFAASYTGGQTITEYNFTFGDGTYTLTANPAASHTYAYPGTYIASVQAKIQGSWHDNYGRLLLLKILPGTSLSNLAEIPGVAGAVTANTSGGANPTAVLHAGNSVTVNGSYTSQPSDPLSVPIAPTLTGSAGVTLTGTTSGASTVSASATFANPGVYTITMNGGGTVGATTYVQNYVWSVFVGASGTKLGYAVAGTGTGGGGGGGGGPVFTSPHKGNLNVYEYTGSAPYSEDPAIDYETLGYEPILNVYQTLIGYNGSQTGTTYSSYVPMLATCVPGSPQCQSQWGAGFTGISADQKDFTFVLDPKARFYDPGTGNSWAVYPSDVVFSLLRTMAFSTLPCVECNNGWIITQALLSAGSSSWDGGLHAVFNNTPAASFGAFSVNDSAFCPAAAMTSANGCVTIHANANGYAWPYFLELIADALGSAIVPCGWFSASAQGAGIPGWTNGSISGTGDRPCTLPGGVTTTNSSAYASAVAAMNPTSWDSWESVGSTSYIGTVQWSMVGSGPYYMANYQIGASYFLKVNPAYQQPTGCTWTAGCDPAVGSYAKNVSVIWEISSPTQGEQAYSAGVADFAGVPLSDLSFLLKLVNQGTVNIASSPTLSIYFWPFDMNFNLASEQANLVPQLNVPSNWFSFVGMRQFFVHAYPYTTMLTTVGTRSGIQFYQNYGGAIPHNMANYYQGNISWPAGDPNGSASTVGSAAWYYAQMSVSSSPLYDPQLASCSSGSPCIVAMIGQTAAPDLDQRIQAWATSIASLSGGAIQLATTDISFSRLVGYSLGSSPGNNPMPVFQLGWAPDYPDPTDYVLPLYGSNGTYNYGDAVYQQLTNQTQGFDAASCHVFSDYGYWANLASTGQIPNGCQGSAYRALQAAMAAAAFETDNQKRVVEYWQAEEIANGLAMYVYWGQQIRVPSYAAWIDGTSINTNVTIGGGSDEPWYQITGNGVAG